VRGVGDGVGDLLAGAETAINQFARDQPLQHALVVAHVFGLPQDRLFPGEAEPGEVFVDRGLELRARPALVDVFDPEQEAPARRACGLERGQR